MIVGGAARTSPGNSRRAFPDRRRNPTARPRGDCLRLGQDRTKEDRQHQARTGRVTRLAVVEGDRVKAGQFLLQIDPVMAESAVRRDEAGVAAADTGLDQSRTQVRSAQANLELARQNMKRQQDLWTGGLTTRETLEKTQSELDVREAELRASEQEVKTRRGATSSAAGGLTSTRHSLAQSRFEAPFDGIVTRRNVEVGENVVVGTMNNAGTVLLTVADMSVIEAEIEVDETDIPLVQLGQVAKVTIDAMDDRSFRGRVTEIGNSPIQATGAQPGTQRTATNFKVVVTLDDQIRDVRPGFTARPRSPRPRGRRRWRFRFRRSRFAS